MNEAKALALPAALAYAGVRGSEMLGAKSALTQILFGVLGAGVGLWAAKKL